MVVRFFSSRGDGENSSENSICRVQTSENSICCVQTIADDQTTEGKELLSNHYPL